VEIKKFVNINANFLARFRTKEKKQKLEHGEIWWDHG
jgi:hypothetical protein